MTALTVTVTEPAAAMSPRLQVRLLSVAGRAAATAGADAVDRRKLRKRHVGRELIGQRRLVGSTGTVVGHDHLPLERLPVLKWRRG